eukprot:6479962-Amphidinium_carterae.2
MGPRCGIVAIILWRTIMRRKQRPEVALHLWRAIMNARGMQHLHASEHSAASGVLVHMSCLVQREPARSSLLGLNALRKQRLLSGSGYRQIHQVLISAMLQQMYSLPNEFKPRASGKRAVMPCSWLRPQQLGQNIYHVSRHRHALILVVTLQHRAVQKLLSDGLQSSMQLPWQMPLSREAVRQVWVGCHQVSPQLCLAHEVAPDQGEQQVRPVIPVSRSGRAL